MAHLVSLDKEIVTNIAQQVGDFLDQGIGEFEKNENLQIAESFPVWLLLASEIFNESVKERFQATGYFHFQIHENNRPIGFARAKIFGPQKNDWALSSVFKSQLSSNIEEAISIIDRLDIQGEARILEAPAWFISTLWIANDFDNDSFIIVNTLNRDIFPLFQPLTENNFFSLLRNAPIVDGRKTHF